jgi:4'-phosphopantetheinyl transferase EntD
MIEKIVPAQVSAVETFGDLPGARLHPEEEAVMATAVERRRREFATGRACARAALARLGVPVGPILPGPSRAPQWPDGIVGAITHCAGYWASAVARREDILALGVDAEPNDELPDGVIDLIATETERSRLAGQRRSPGGDVHWDRLLFSAKESVYKTWFPLTQRWLGFMDADVRVDPDAGTFTARLLVPGPRLPDRELTGFSGQWLACDGLLLTAITVPA